MTIYDSLSRVVLDLPGRYAIRVVGERAEIRRLLRRGGEPPEDDEYEVEVETYETHGSRWRKWTATRPSTGFTARSQSSEGILDAIAEDAGVSR